MQTADRGSNIWVLVFGIWTEINNKSDPNYCVQIRYLESRLDWLYLHYQYWANNSLNWIEIYTPTASLLMTWSYLHLSPLKLGLETGMICDFPCYKISVKPIFHEASNPSESSSSPLVLVRDHLLWNKRQGINIIMSIVITREPPSPDFHISKQGFIGLLMHWLHEFSLSLLPLLSIILLSSGSDGINVLHDPGFPNPRPPAPQVACWLVS